MRFVGRTLTVALLLCCAGDAASANSGGIVGFSGKPPARSCNQCHSGGTDPAVSFDGPSEVAAGAVATFRFTVTSRGVAQTGAGFNVAASAGTLGVVTAADTQLRSGELTHRGPKANSDGVAFWEFHWTAPAEPGSYTLFGTGNSVNLNRDNSGDRAAATTLTVNVLAGADTETPTATPTATDTPTASVTPTDPPTPTVTPTDTPPSPVSPTPTATAGVACAGDCTSDSQVNIDELVRGVAIALGNLPIDNCPAFDLNRDGVVAINELVLAVSAALNGCP